MAARSESPSRSIFRTAGSADSTDTISTDMTSSSPASSSYVQPGQSIPSVPSNLTRKTASYNTRQLFSLGLYEPIFPHDFDFSNADSSSASYDSTDTISTEISGSSLASSSDVQSRQSIPSELTRTATQDCLPQSPLSVYDGNIGLGSALGLEILGFDETLELGDPELARVLGFDSTLTDIVFGRSNYNGDSNEQNKSPSLTSLNRNNPASEQCLLEIRPHNTKLASSNSPVLSMPSSPANIPPGLPVPLLQQNYMSLPKFDDAFVPRVETFHMPLERDTNLRTAISQGPKCVLNELNKQVLIAKEQLDGSSLVEQQSALARVENDSDKFRTFNTPPMPGFHMTQPVSSDQGSVSEVGESYSTTHTSDDSRNGHEFPTPWSDSSDDETEWEESGSILGPVRSRIVQLLLAAFTSSYSDFRSCKSGQLPTSSISSGANPETSRNTSRSAQEESKNPRKRKSNGSPNNDDDHPFKRSRSEASSQDDDSRLLACPFCKYNPRTYSKCNKYILKEISRLKQHLARCHRVPIHCALCFEVFEGEEKRDEHLRERSCSILPAKVFEGVNDSQKKLLEQRISTRKSRKENWYIIYEILFPNSPLPRSPYVDPYLSEELLALQEFAAAEGPSIVRDFIQAELPDTFRPNEQELHAFCQRLFQDSVAMLLERREMHASLLPDPPTGSSLSLCNLPGISDQANSQTLVNSSPETPNSNAGNSMPRNLPSTHDMFGVHTSYRTSTPPMGNLIALTVDSGYSRSFSGGGQILDMQCSPADQMSLGLGHDLGDIGGGMMDFLNPIDPDAFVFDHDLNQTFQRRRENGV